MRSICTTFAFVAIAFDSFCGFMFRSPSPSQFDMCLCLFLSVRICCRLNLFFCLHSLRDYAENIIYDCLVSIKWSVCVSVPLIFAIAVAHTNGDFSSALASIEAEKFELPNFSWGNVFIFAILLFCEIEFVSVIGWHSPQKE